MESAKLTQQKNSDKDSTFVDAVTSLLTLKLAVVAYQGAVFEMRRNRRGYLRKAAVFLDGELEKMLPAMTSFLAVVRAGILLQPAPTEESLREYNKAIPGVLEPYRAIRLRRDTINSLKKWLDSPQQTVCGYCGRLFLPARGIKGYCSEKCKTGNHNRQQFEKRMGR